MSEQFSNYREVRNVLKVLEDEGKAGWLQGKENFMFGDNSTREATYYRGFSSSKFLYELVLQLWVVELKHGCIINLIPYTETRMIAQGTGGISHGCFGECIM
eukprot:12228726-Ditylum_brightwellii.AAC.2